MAGDSGPNNDCGRPECAKQPTIDKRQSAGAEVSAHTSLEPSADAKKHKRLRLFGAKTNEKQQSPGAQDVKPAMVSLLQLFRFSDALDRALMAIGAIAACVAGSGMPLMTVVISDLTDSFLAFNYGGNSGQTLDHTTRKYCLYFLALGLGMWVVASIQQLCWSIAAERTGRRVREAFYIAILRQDIGWFDDISTGELITRISGDVNLIQEGTGEKFSYVIQHVATFLTGAIIAFVKGWKLTLVVLSIVPMYAGTMSLLIVTIAKGTTSGQNAYAEAGSVADEVLSSIKTVMAFGGEGRELERYDEKIKKARAVGLRKALVMGVSAGVIMFSVYSMYALAFWYGGKLVRQGEMQAGTVLNVLLSILIGGSSFANTAPNVSSIAGARGAAVKVYEVIDRKSPIDPVETENGLSAENIAGEIELSSVNFRYPTRKDVQVLHDFSIHVKPGQKIALVGESGCGKSTMISLVERFYDPESGAVRIDGIDIKEYNVRSLRQQIGVIMQMPILFGYSIYQNIVWGATDIDGSPPTKEQVIQACKDANAHDFISELPDGYDTMCGERGALLSGGQKQRIAIARALVRNPKILLLDEATSALDTAAERVVQEALDRASANRTTITVAHRLSTIKDSDVIYVISKGHIIEYGSHEELIENNGAYAKLVEAQQLRQTLEKDISKSDDESDSDSNNVNSEIKAIPTTIQRTETGKSTLRSTSIQRTSTGQSLINEGKEMGFASEDDGRSIEQKNKELQKRGRRALPKLIRMNKMRLKMAIPGILFSIIDGAALPCLSLVFSRVLVALSIADKKKQTKEVNFYAGMFFLFAGVMLFAASGRFFLFGRIGEQIAYHVRRGLFRSLMNQDAAYFDKKENGTGALTARLETESADICNLCSEAFPTFVSGITSIIAGVCIAFTHDWRLTLVVLATVPFLVLAYMIQAKAMLQAIMAMKGAYEKASQEAAETVANIRTVTTLTREHTFIQQFKDNSIGPYRNAIKNHYVSSFGYGFAQSTMFLVYSLAFYVGSRFVLDGYIDTEKMFNVMFSIIFSTFSLGLMAQRASTATKALVASEKIISTLESMPAIDAHSDDGLKVKSEDATGDVSAQKVRFAYPTRPRATILRGISLNVTPGKTIALVGPSGSGKSTIIGLIQRLYDVLSGSVSVEKTDVREWNVKSLRDNLSLVGQEPVLFDYTIAENIAYGRPGATQMEIEAVAKQANIHNFISELPDGYNTRIGQTGGRLSGGQKQRIAIARALVRNPKILLLDEASSALDSQSEKLVQEALDKASEGRTTITIAHRLSTIQNADKIIVFKNGRIIEHGTHDELLRQKGLYSLLVAQQSLQITQ